MQKLYLLGVTAVWGRTRAGKSIFSLHREPSTSCTLGLQCTVIQSSLPLGHTYVASTGAFSLGRYLFISLYGSGVKTSLRKRTILYATQCWKRIRSACKVITVSHKAFVVSEPWACPLSNPPWFCFKGQGVEFLGLLHFSCFSLQYPQAFCLRASHTPECPMERLSWGFLAPKFPVLSLWNWSWLLLSCFATVFLLVWSLGPDSQPVIRLRTLPELQPAFLQRLKQELNSVRFSVPQTPGAV